MKIRPALAVSAAAMLLGLTACGGSVAFSDAGQPASATSAPANQGELEVIASAVKAIGEVSHADSYAGVAIVTDAGVVQVWRKPSTAFDQALNAQFWHDKIIISDAPYTATELTALQQTISADTDYWAARGVVLRRIGPRHDGSCVDVGLDKPDAAKEAFTARYPDQPLCFGEAAGRLPAN